MSDATQHTALVTGCAGFVGSYLTESLLEAGIHVIGVDCFNDNYGRSEKLRNLQIARNWDEFEFVPLDLARGDLEDLVSEADVIYHLAAEPGVRSSWGNRFDNYLRNNLLATQHMLEAARLQPGRRFVYTSSSSIYGNAETLPTSESTVPQPFSPYGVTKLAGEHMCSLYHGNHGVETVSLRLFTVYGPRQRPDMAFRRFCEAVVTDDPIVVYGDGGQTRDFTYVDDIVAALRSAAECPGVAGKVYNIGGGSTVSVNDALTLLAEYSPRRFRVEHQAVVAGDVRATGADTTAARRDLGFDPKTSFADGLLNEFNWVLGGR
jgi:UDP-glucuronate 4-epimerase